jgi:tRNA dimethylallyltransferase
VRVSADPFDQAQARLRDCPPDPAQPVLLAGPTASGKSALALDVAQRQGRVVVNADALQVHDSWQVLSARPAPEEMQGIPHLLYGCVARGQEWSVGHWLRAMQDILTQFPNPVIVGGTGLYFRALTEGLAEIPATPAAIRAQADARVQADGASVLLAELDQATAARIDRANPARIQRAWEVLQTTGQGLALWQDRTPPPLLSPDRCARYLLSPPVPWLENRIAHRFAQMIGKGALDEARAALQHWDPAAPWAKAIGAPELVAHLQGHMSLPDAIAAATLATRRYAKRQRTWARARMADWCKLSG